MLIIKLAFSWNLRMVMGLLKNSISFWMNQENTLLFSFLVIIICSQECKFAKQELHKLRRENGSLDTERHEHSKTVSQLQTKVAVLEQELRDKEQVADQNINICLTDCHYISININSKYLKWCTCISTLQFLVVTPSYRHLEFSRFSQPKRFLYRCMVSTESSGYKILNVYLKCVPLLPKKS